MRNKGRRNERREELIKDRGREEKQEACYSASLSRCFSTDDHFFILP